MAPPRKYCCPGAEGACSQASFPVPDTLLASKGRKQYAIITLLMRGDAYLPGALMLARSLREAHPKLASEVDLICMVTADVSAMARKDLATEFDKVDPVDYIEIPEALVNHSKPEVRPSYAKTFTKLRCLLYTQYKKVLLMDADMLVVRPEVFGLFDLATPAAIFMGCLRQFMPTQFDDHVTAYCSRLAHGAIVPPDLFANKTCGGLPDTVAPDQRRDKRVYVGMETSLVLLEPSKKEFEAMLAKLAAARALRVPKYSGDTMLLSEHYEGKWRSMDMRFLGRWTTPTLRPEVFTVDLYGSDGKPWDAPKRPELRKWVDIAFWLAEFGKAYRTRFAKTCHHPGLRQLL